jgi:hypothetical protein
MVIDMVIDMAIVMVIMAHGAAKAPEAALFVAPAHVAVQAVLHQVGAFKIVAFHRRDNKHAC